MGTAAPAAPERAIPLRGARIAVRAVSLGAGGGPVLQDISFTAAPGELVAIVGVSGAGKTTLLEALAGARRIDTGQVSFDGAKRDGVALGFVPQDDLVHRELRLRRALRYAAGLRLPAGTPRAEAAAAVTTTLAALGLSGRADARVGTLSGGERKRASIGVELLARPGVLLLDEPTSGLDPDGRREILRLLRELADAGGTVVLSTHAMGDIESCDRVVVLREGGRLDFVGAPGELAEWRDGGGAEPRPEPAAWRDGGGAEPRPEPAAWRDGGPAERAARPVGEPAAPAAAAARTPAPRRAGFGRQFGLLTRRTLEILAGSRLTLAIVLGSPLIIVAMFLVLFRPGAFTPATASPTAAIMILFWISFGSFFFGLTYGLPQVVAELPIVRRERVAGLSIGAYVLAKIAALLPLLAAVDVAMLAALRALDRLPAASAGTYATLVAITVVSSAAALALGLATSALVHDAPQAMMALPMLCFPQVLFSGAIIPVPLTPLLGQAISALVLTRWTFEALGHAIGLESLLADGSSPLGPPLLAQYGDSFARAPAADMLIVAAFAGLYTGVTWAVLARRSRGPAR